MPFSLVEIIRLPFEEKPKKQSPEASPSIRRISLPVSTSNRRRALMSCVQPARKRPSGEKQPPDPNASFTLFFRSSLPVALSQRVRKRGVQSGGSGSSRWEVVRILPSAEKESSWTAETSPIVARHCPLATS